MQPAFVERLDAWTLPEQAGMALPPIMIYGDDVTHILTEEGIANLLLCRSDEEREQAIRGVAGYTPVGPGARPARGGEPARPRRDPPRRKTSASTRATPRATCWPRAACATWCAHRAACTSRPSASATGEGHDMSDIPWASKPWTSLSPAAGRRRLRAGAGRRGRLGQPRSAARSRAPATAARCASRPRRAASVRSGRRCCDDFHARHPLGGVRVSINDMGATPAVVSLRLDQAVAELPQEAHAA